MNLPPKHVSARVAEILGREPSSWRVMTGGYTPALRYVVEADGVSAFVKAAATPLTATLLKREINAYRVVLPRVRPALLGWYDDDAQPVLVIEDMRTAYWPPPWTDGTIARALETIDALHGSSADLPSFDAVHGCSEPGWQEVASDPVPFLSLGLVPADWLRAALPALREAEAACPTGGTTPAHFDIRSDNMCFVADGSMKLVDWAEACLANATLDLGFWLPSLASEGGPPPEVILPSAPDVAAWVAGFFAARAGLPDIPDAPYVRDVQRRQLATALPWAQRALRLPPF